MCDYYGPSQTPYYRNRARDFKLPEQHTLHEEYANPRMEVHVPKQYIHGPQSTYIRTTKLPGYMDPWV